MGATTAAGRDTLMSEGAAMHRIRIIFKKNGWITFVNHMDLPTAFSRAARRAELSQEFTQGYSPHPHISLGPPLAIGVVGLAEPAEFWFNEWDSDSVKKWNLCMPEGIEIIKYAEVEGQALAKLTTAGTYKIEGVGFTLDEHALAVIKEEVCAKGILFESSIDSGIVTVTIGDLEHCSAGCLVKSLKENDICSGWPDLRIVRTCVGTWDNDSETVLPLI